MLYKCQIAWILLLPISSSILSVIVYNTPIATAQQDNANFLTYTNTHLGFTIKYPSDWTVEESYIPIRNEVIFAPPDKGGIVGVMIGNITPEEAARINASSSSSATTNDSATQIPSNLSSSTKLLELDISRYLLSGHPAIRIVEIQSFGGPGQPQSPQYPEPHDTKAMLYNLILDGKWYKVAYAVTPPEDFPRYLQTAQSMIDSFQIISKQ